MVNKKLNFKKAINAEKYIFCILLLGYILGICIGSFFVLDNAENATFTSNVMSDKNFKALLYFIIALLLKYSGVLSGLLIILPMFLGIHNSAGYSCIILNNESLKYKTAFAMLKDTAIVMLLVLYIVLIVNQIINKKYNLKKDCKYFIVYFGASSLIILIEQLINTILF